MRKLLALAVVSILGICLTAGCGSGIKTYTEEERTISIGVNREFVIALDSNPTTGYGWEQSHDDSILKLVEDKYEADRKAAGLVGVGGTQYFRFKALKTGKTEVKVAYKRPWEKETAKQKVFNVDIH